MFDFRKLMRLAAVVMAVLLMAAPMNTFAAPAERIYTEICSYIATLNFCDSIEGSVVFSDIEFDGVSLSDEKYRAIGAEAAREEIMIKGDLLYRADYTQMPITELNNYPDRKFRVLIGHNSLGLYVLGMWQLGV